MEGPGAFDRLEGDWRRLTGTTAIDRFDLSFDESRDAWRIFEKRGGHTLRIAVGREGDRIVLIWPIVEHKLLAWKRGIWLGVSYDYRDVATEDSPERERWIELAWTFIKGKMGIDMVWCPGIRGNSNIFPLLETETSAAVVRGTCLFLKSHEWSSWEDYYAGLRTSYRADQRRRLRRLAEAGDVSFDRVTDPEQIDEMLDWGLQHKQKWSERMGVEVTFTKDYLPYFKASAKRAQQEGTLILGVLKLNGTTLAIVLSFLRGRSLVLQNAIYDRTYMAYGPGRLIWERVLEWGFEKEAEIIDFKSGTEKYKYTFNPEAVALNSYLVPCSAWGRVYLAWYRGAARRAVKALFSRSPAGLRRLARALLLRP